MGKEINSKINKLETWNSIQILSWILYTIAIITFVLIHQNILEERILLSVPLSGSSITFGFPTLIFLVGAFFNIWSIYIEKNEKQNSKNNSFLLALGFTLSVSIAAFLVVIMITFIELKFL